MKAQKSWDIEGMTPKEVMEKILATFIEIERQAIEFGHQRGYDKGYDKGFDEGFDAGMKKGYKDGHRDGMTEAVTTITE